MVMMKMRCSWSLTADDKSLFFLLIPLQTQISAFLSVRTIMAFPAFPAFPDTNLELGLTEDLRYQTGR